MKKINKKFLIVYNDKKFIFENVEDAMNFIATFHISGGKGR